MTSDDTVADVNSRSHSRLDAKEPFIFQLAATSLARTMNPGVGGSASRLAWFLDEQPVQDWVTGVAASVASAFIERRTRPFSSASITLTLTC